VNLYEYTGNLHMHTPYSDGEAYHDEIAAAAARAGLDFVVVTDHNVWVDGVEGYYAHDGRQVLLMVGEEVHDMRREPQANHLLAYNARQELAPIAANPQAVLDAVNASAGLSFIAHPIDKPAPLFHEPGLPWEAWEVHGYTGIELWNFMSEFKTYLTSYPAAIRVAQEPDRFISGPFPEALALWDKLLAEGRLVRAIGGADAHGTTYSVGSLTRVVFPYEFLFRCVNTHVLTARPLTGEFETDRDIVFRAIMDGRCYIGYDLPAPTHGFRFTANGHNFTTTMGGQIKLGHGVTLQVVSPKIAEMRLLYNGEVLFTETENTHRTYIATKPGTYRVEIHIQHKGKRRGWIFSNPIFVFE